MSQQTKPFLFSMIPIVLQHCVHSTNVEYLQESHREFVQYSDKYHEEQATETGGEWKEGKKNKKKRNGGKRTKINKKERKIPGFPPLFP